MKLEIKDLSICYHDAWVLRHFDLHMYEGEFVSIVGPSGCGKSTLLRLLSGTLPREHGQVFVDSQEINGISSHFSFMPQDDLLLPWLTVMDNICLPGKIQGNLSTVRQKAQENLPLFGLSGIGSSYPHTLSGGMRQRAAFLRTSLCQSDILLLDEPFASLDVITKEEMQDWLLSMRTSLGRTILLVTHDIEEAIYLSNRIVILSGQPAKIQSEVLISQAERNRLWLEQQSDLKREIYACLKENAVSELVK